MCFLPLCHIAERMGGEYFAMYTGSILNFVENPETVPENVREIAPTVFTAVPRVWEKFYSGVMIALQGSRAALQQAAYALEHRRRHAIADRVLAGAAGRRARCKLQVPHRALARAGQRAQADRHPPRALPASPARRRSRPSWCKLVPRARRADARGLGHDRDRCGAATGVPATRIKPGIDRPGRRATTRCGIDPATGEILVRGSNVFMGYLNQPEKTAETIDADGWLHTGDVGTMDDDGYFRITDRMKDIIITAGGKNITPSELENELKFSPYITDAVVDRRQAALPHGDRHDRPGERREVRPGPRRALQQLRRA